jgi:predicted ArsR family transcriptional regulator
MTKIAQILAILGDGAATTDEIARRLRFRRRHVSVTLCHLAAVGRVERAGSVGGGRIGRPFVRWRLRR